MKTSSRYLLEALGPLVTVVLLGVLWQAADSYFGIPRFLLPAPGDVYDTIIDNAGLILRETWATTRIILLGFAISVVVGVPLGYFIVRFPRVNQTVYPVVVALQFFPKTILAPLLVVWFGIGVMPKSVLIMLMSFFPILVESIVGFRQVDPRLFHVTATMGATPRQDFWNVLVPSAVPHIVSGMKAAMIYAVIAAIVAEYVGSNEGIGHLILYASGSFDMPMVFAGILVAAVLGVVLSAAMLIAEHLVMPWRRSMK